MNEKIKHIWIDALTSGEYKQGKGGLKDYIGYYCCLGVLCDLHSKMTRNNGWGFLGDYLGKQGTLPEEVVERSNLSDRNGSYAEKCGFRSLIMDNDSGKSFMEIAEIIEDNF